MEPDEPGPSHVTLRSTANTAKQCGHNVWLMCVFQMEPDEPGHSRATMSQPPKLHWAMEMERDLRVNFISFYSLNYLHIHFRFRN